MSSASLSNNDITNIRLFCSLFLITYSSPLFHGDMFRRSSRTSLRLSLDRTETHPNSVCPAWLDKHQSDIFRVRAMDNESALYWMDEDNEKLSLAFPAILNLIKTYVHNERYDILRHIQVSFIVFFLFFSHYVLLEIKNFVISNIHNNIFPFTTTKHTKS